MIPKVLLYILLLSTTTQLPGIFSNSLIVSPNTSPLPPNSLVLYTTHINDCTFLCGTITTSPDEESPMVHSVAFFAKINKSGELLWLQKYWGDEHNTLSTLIEVEDGYLLAGSSYSRYGSTCMVIRTDFEGNSLWIKYSGDGMTTEAKNITKICAETYAISAVNKDWESTSIPYIIKININGNILN